MFDAHHMCIGSAKASISPSACNIHTSLFLINIAYCIISFTCVCIWPRSEHSTRYSHGTTRLLRSI